MGFGKSDTPEHRTYWLQDHIDNIERFVLALDLNDITLVMHDFGGPVGMGLAARHPGRIRRIVSTNGPTPFGQRTLFDRLNANAAASPWFQWIVRAESQGRLETVLGELGFNILSTLKLNGFENHTRINDTWLRAYGCRTRRFAWNANSVGSYVRLKLDDVLSPVQGQFEAYNARDLECFLQYFHEDVIVYRAHQPQAAIVGKANLADFYRTQRFNLPTLKAELLSRTTMGNKVFDFERITGVAAAPVEMAAVFEVRDRLIVAMWAFPAD